MEYLDTHKLFPGGEVQGDVIVKPDDTTLVVPF